MSSKSTVIAAIVGGTLAYFAYYHFKKKLCSKQPQRWKKVGEVSDLLCYPVKSCASISMNEVDCHQNGFKIGNFHDRTFMLINKDGKFITAPVHPKLLKVFPKVDGSSLILSAPGMNDLVIDPLKLTGENVKVRIFDQFFDALDVGDETSAWFCEFLEQENFSLRLVFYPSSLPSRDVRDCNKVFKEMIKDDSGALHNITSYMLVNQSSVDDLNTRLSNAVTSLHFRPNIVVKGAKAYEEDNWKWVRIGNVVFRNVKQCARCPFVTIDPVTTEKDVEREPLKTLRTYRKLESAGRKTVMGIHLGIRVRGKIALGDSVFVDDG